MCEATAFLLGDDGREDLVLKDVDILRPRGKRIYLCDIFGEQREIEAQIKEISLLHHRILLKKRVDPRWKRRSANRP